MCFDKIRLYLNAEFMSYNNYNNNYPINSNYGFGGSNYSNITNYTTLQQDKVSQVVNLLNQCSIEQLEKINDKLAEIQKKKEKQFRNDIYMWCSINRQILNQINDAEFGAALQCNGVLFGQQQASLYKYMHLKRFITKVLQSRTPDYDSSYSHITDRKDVNAFEKNAWQIVQNAQQAIIDIKAQDPTNYNRHLQNGNMRAQTQKFMENTFFNWFRSMMNNGLWIPADGPVPNYIMYTDKQKNAERDALCRRAEQILRYTNNIDNLAKFLNCQLSDVITEVKKFMQQCDAFIQRYGKHQNITNYTNYGLAKSYNNNMIGYSGYNNW